MWRQMRAESSEARILSKGRRLRLRQAATAAEVPVTPNLCSRRQALPFLTPLALHRNPGRWTPILCFGVMGFEGHEAVGAIFKPSMHRAPKAHACSQPLGSPGQYREYLQFPQNHYNQGSLGPPGAEPWLSWEPKSGHGPRLDPPENFARILMRGASPLVWKAQA